MGNQPTEKSTEKSQGAQQTPPEATQRQPQSRELQPNKNIQPPQYQLITEGYDPRASNQKRGDQN